MLRMIVNAAALFVIALVGAIFLVGVFLWANEIIAL